MQALDNGSPVGSHHASTKMAGANDRMCIFSRTLLVIKGGPPNK